MARPSTALVGAAALAVAVLGPALGPGYVLNADEVFVPEQDLLPWMLGAGGGLPRSVPQDAVVAVLSGPVPGWVWEKSALVALVALLAVGVGRLALPRGRGAAVVAALVAVWSGYVAERLLLGHWSLLLALAALPWALDAARRCREGRPAAGAAWLLWLALASLTVTGGLLVVGLTLPVLLWRGGAGTGRHRAAVALLGGVLQLPWLVPALMRGSVVAAGADVFAARSEGPWGVLVTVLGTGGVWNADAVPGSRSTGWAVVLGLLVLVVAAVGARDVVAVVGRPIALSLTVGSVLGLAWACASAWAVTQPAVAWIVATLPGGGVLRDAHKWIAPWVILLALAAGLGAARLARAARARGGDLVAARAVLVAVALLPVVAMPDLAWGAAGRLTAVAYPDDLGEVRAVLAAQPEGDAVSLPWQAFRRFPWNHEGRTSLDPVPRAMPRTTLVSGTLVVRRGDELVSVAGDDPRALRIDAALEAGTPLGPVLAEEGVAYAVVASDLPDATDDLPTGSVPLYEGASFSLYRLALPADPVPPTGPVAGLAAAALAAAVLVATGAAVARVRARHP